jgi:hypothetical protein
MKIEKDLRDWYYPNMFHIVELQADVMRVCDLLSLFYPMNLANNSESNFIFIPVTWANNLFQSWTEDPQCAAVNTTDAAASTTGGQLSRPSKMTTNRKKALILIVNKPDWFEPQELTYLGFNNDFSEVPMAESDKIDFSIDYGNTARKFLDGSAYNGTIAGPKKILTYATTSGTVSRSDTSGYYETTSADEKASGRLSFPEKYLLKITVEPLMTWQAVDVSSISNSVGGSVWGVAPSIDGCAVVTNEGAIFSNDGTNWSVLGAKFSEDTYRGIVYGNRKYVATRYSGERRIYENSSWSDVVQIGNGAENIYFDEVNNRFIAVSGAKIGISADATSWEIKTLPISITDITGTANGFMAINGSNSTQSKAYISSDLVTWQQVDNGLLPARKMMSICHHNGCYYAVTHDPGECYKSSDGGRNWVLITKFPSSYLGARCIRWCSKFGKFVATNYIKQVLLGSENGSLTFTNVTGDSEKHAIAEKTTFYVEASQMSDVKDANGDYSVDFDMENIRLVSAEITNVSTERIAPVTATYNDVDIIDFTRGQTAGKLLSLATTTDTVVYNAG